MTVKFNDIINETPARVAIIGAAKSGIAAAKYFLSRGSDVFISDTCSRERLDDILSENNLTNISKNGLTNISKNDLTNKVDSEAGRHTEKILECELIILSPGVCSDLDILKKASIKNIPIWSEMELGFRVSKAPFLAVTGSSGKSTTVSLLASVMSESGFETALAGNIGTPVISVTPNLPQSAIVVAEVSSFQLETIERFRPKVAAVINLMKNHLDRYANEEEYYNAKKRIAENLTSEDCIVLNSDDVHLRSWIKDFTPRTRVVLFGSHRSSGDCVYLADNAIHYQSNGISKIILDDVTQMKLSGRHNHINACAAAAVALAAGVDPEYIGKGLCAFAGLPHRLEYVADINGISFYNDSKSTTAESIECAINAFDSKVHLIAGGRDKGCDFSVIRDAVRSNVKSVVLIGEAKERMAAEWEDIVSVLKASTLEEAIRIAFKNANVGEKVIFSPGCSSFDMFRNFEHRGDSFKETVSLVSREVC